MLRTRVLAGMGDKALSRELQMDENVTIENIKLECKCISVLLAKIVL